jgi:hypothetical protein
MQSTVTIIYWNNVTFRCSSLNMLEDFRSQLLPVGGYCVRIALNSKWKRIQDDGHYRALVKVRILEIQIFFLSKHFVRIKFKGTLSQRSFEYVQVKIIKYMGNYFYYLTVHFCYLFIKMTNKCIHFFISLVFRSYMFWHIHAIFREPVCTF